MYAVSYTHLEDRDLFVKKLDEIPMKTPKSHAVESMADALKAARELGYQMCLRDSTNRDISPVQESAIGIDKDMFTQPDTIPRVAMERWTDDGRGGKARYQLLQQAPVILSLIHIWKPAQGRFRHLHGFFFL